MLRCSARQMRMCDSLGSSGDGERRARHVRCHDISDHRLPGRAGAEYVLAVGCDCASRCNPVARAELLGTDLLQTTITNLRWGVNEVAYLRRTPQAARPLVGAQSNVCETVRSFPPLQNAAGFVIIPIRQVALWPMS